MRPPAIKVEAGKIGIPIMQPEKLANPQALDQIRAWGPDVIVVAAFGQILKPEMLDLPRHGCVNVHASLLPRWRGAAPIQAAIAAGDAQSGSSVGSIGRARSRRGRSRASSRERRTRDRWASTGSGRGFGVRLRAR